MPALFSFNTLLVISDGLEARIGTLTGGREWFKPWRTITGETEAPKTAVELQVMLEGVFDKRRLLDLIGYFIVFEDAGDGSLVKKMAGYHQFHAVNVAVAETLRAAQLSEVGQDAILSHKGGDPGDRRIGVVWHTQGAGKSYSMVFYAQMLRRDTAFANPTIVAVTDRNDLDQQLYETFAAQRELGQSVRQAEEIAGGEESLHALLQVPAGGIVFTTIQKFRPAKGQTQMPVLTDRENVIVLADGVCCGQKPSTVAARPGWDRISAVRTGSIVRIDDSIASRWGPRLVNFFRAMSSALARLQ